MESCGNTPAFNAVKILPCAEGPALHMGADPLNTGILEKIPEPRGKLEVDPWERPSPMCNTTTRAGKSSLTEAPLPIILCAGSMFVMWFGERIIDKGIGNGISMLIIIDIIARLPQAITQEFIVKLGENGAGGHDEVLYSDRKSVV